MVGVKASVSTGRWHPLVAGRGGTEVAISVSVINSVVGQIASVHLYGRHLRSLLQKLVVLSYTLQHRVMLW